MLTKLETEYVLLKNYAKIANETLETDPEKAEKMIFEIWDELLKDIPGTEPGNVIRKNHLKSVK